MALSFHWWNKNDHRRMSVVVKMQNPNWSMLELKGQSEDDFVVGRGGLPGRDQDKACGKNAKQLTWVLLLKAHQTAGCFTSFGAALMALSSVIRCRVISGRTDAKMDAQTDIENENSTLKFRFYSCIKVFLWLSLLLFGEAYRLIFLLKRDKNLLQG